MINAKDAHTQVDSAVLAVAGGTLEDRTSATNKKAAMYLAEIREIIERAMSKRLYFAKFTVNDMVVVQVVAHLRSLGYLCSFKVDTELVGEPIEITVIW